MGVINIKKILTSLLVAFVGFFTYTGSVFALTNYFNGFEVDTNNWFNDGVEINRVASGTGGITSADGSYHALASEGAFTRWGGYESPFPADGYVTKLDIYLDMSLADGTDKRFDYSSAINNPAGFHRRDFIFSGGTIFGATGQWAVSASNNAPGWPNNPSRNPITISQTGWYTFEHTFQDNGSGVLEVVMKVKDSSDNVLGTWTLSDPSDVIGSTVGGNRYGWLVNSAFVTLPFDNSTKYNIVPRVGPPSEKDQCKKDGWKIFNYPVFKNQGDCVSFVQSNEHAGKRLQTFLATNSQYYNGLSTSDGLYATGPISFTWDLVTGVVTGGYWNEVYPANTGNTYYNIITSGTVVGNAVNLTFDRTNPDSNHFTFIGNLVDGVLTGQMSGPYLFTATGI